MIMVITYELYHIYWLTLHPIIAGAAATAAE